jgi:uncharacterized protein
MKRRDFLKTAGITGVAMALSGRSAAVPVQPQVPRTILGKTGLDVPIIGLGTGTTGPGLDNADAVALYHETIDKGVTYIDTAPMYERAQAQLSEVLRDRRDEVTIVTKSFANTKEEFLDILKSNLKTLGIEQADITFVHSVGDLDMDRVMGPDGAYEGALEAKRLGLTRFIAFSAHNRVQNSVRALREGEFDVVMVPVNFADRNTYGFEREVIPMAREKGLGIIAMKVYGGAPRMNYTKPTPSALGTHGPHDHQAALRYSLSQPGVNMAVIGMYNGRELDNNIQWAANLTPLSDTEHANLDTLGQQIAGDWGNHFGPPS